MSFSIEIVWTGRSDHSVKTTDCFLRMFNIVRFNPYKPFGTPLVNEVMINVFIYARTLNTQLARTLSPFISSIHPARERERAEPMLGRSFVLLPDLCLAYSYADLFEQFRRLFGGCHGSSHGKVDDHFDHSWFTVKHAVIKRLPHCWDRVYENSIHLCLVRYSVFCLFEEQQWHIKWAYILCNAPYMS